MGRPDWRSVFRDIRLRHDRETPVDCYFCGPPSLSKVLANLSADQGFRSFTEKW